MDELESVGALRTRQITLKRDLSNHLTMAGIWSRTPTSYEDQYGKTDLGLTDRSC